MKNKNTYLFVPMTNSEYASYLKCEAESYVEAMEAMEMKSWIKYYKKFDHYYPHTIYAVKENGEPEMYYCHR